MIVFQSTRVCGCVWVCVSVCVCMGVSVSVCVWIWNMYVQPVKKNVSEFINPNTLHPSTHPLFPNE